MSARKKVVFFAEAVTLAHIARPVMLANSLDPEKFDVTLAWQPRYQQLFPSLPISQRELFSIQPTDFLAALAAGRPVYRLETLDQYVANDLEILNELAPDLVIGDFRLSLSVSARLAKIPYINITNAYWSPYAKLRIPSPDVPPLRWLPNRVSQTLFNLVRPMAFAHHAEPMRQLHKRFGVPLPPRDVRAVYTFADYVAYADMPELVPMSGLPSTHKFIGPILWSPSGQHPPWWHEVSAIRGPKVYITLGSSGADTILPSVLNALSTLPITCLVATAGRSHLKDVASNVFIADYLSGEEAAAAADFVICNGGSPTAYQALSRGRPVLGICTNLDQQLNMTAVEAAGLGLSLLGSDANARSIHHLTKQLLDTPRFRKNALEVQQLLAGRPAAPRQFSDWLSSIQF